MIRQNALFAVVVFMFFAAQASPNAVAQEQKEMVKIATHAKLGQYLTGSDGHALYYFKKDSPGKSSCMGQCRETWPEYCYAMDEVSFADNLKKTDFSSFHRNDSDTHHLTYKGKPLYNYVGDRNPGDTNGQGIDGQWFLVKP